MFNLSFEKRLAFWRDFRIKLEESEDPLLETINFWKTIPEVSFQADPYDQNTWPSPWQIINENVYCSFVKILAICYTLQLTDRFSQSNFEIHITQDDNEILYWLSVDDLCVNSKYNDIKSIDFLKKLKIEKTYVMSNIQ